MGRNLHQWAQYKDCKKQYGIMTTNASEKFNDVLKGARASPIQVLVSRIFYRLVKYFYKHRTVAETWTILHTPCTMEHLWKQAEFARLNQLECYTQTGYQILDMYGNRFKVELADEKCSCTCNQP